MSTVTKTTNVPLLDLKAQYSSIKDDVDEAVAEVLASQHFIMGPKVRECETAIARYCRCSHAVGVSSGTDALIIALMAEKIGAGDEVITTPYSFFATAGCISRVGARPVFADIDPLTFNIDPNLIEDRITERTKAIIPVHLYGQMADMDPIMDIASRHNLVVIEDAAQAIGAEYKGRRAGSIGHYGCFSFFPAKNLGALGDGGIVTTNDEERASHLETLRVHGARPKYYHRWIGGNFRLDAIHAAVVTVKLRHLDQWTSGRQENAQRYDDLFQQTTLVDRGIVTLPPVATNRHVFNQYVIRVAKRDELVTFLNSEGISTAIYYPLCLHEQECFSDLGYRRGEFPESERASGESLALPIFPELTDEQLHSVVTQITNFFEART